MCLGWRTDGVHANEMDGSLIEMKKYKKIVWLKYVTGWNVHLNKI
jgi:hypothetical protein